MGGCRIPAGAGKPLAVAALALLAWAPAAAAKPSPRLGLEVVSAARADLVTGGDALVAVDVPRKLKPARVKVLSNGRNVSGAFAPVAGHPRRLVGLVGELRPGANLIAARAGRGAVSELAVFNSPPNGPLFSGPQQTPFFCTTENGGLGPPSDADCSAPTTVEYRYRAANGNFRPLPDPAVRPADITQTTTRAGETVDYVVRLESGVINRSIYRWAVLAPGGIAGAGWNGRLIHSFGGGCGAGYQQGGSGPGTVLDHPQLSRGYSVSSASLTVLGTHCNDVLSAETVAMVKEHVIESLGREPAWTLGQGGSGGSIQQQMIGQNYPGLLDGLLPGASFPDTAMTEKPDCRLLQSYFAGAQGAALSDAQKASISGLTNGPDGCSIHAGAADVVNASEGCNEAVVPPEQIFDPVSNPEGIRCTFWDSMVNVFGRDPATGYARRTLDNVGVQYGLQALHEGAIDAGEFLDLNQGIGGFDDNGVQRSQRSVADPEALAIMYRSGRINQGAGGIPEVPIVDVRNYVDDQATNLHQYISTYIFRERLRRTPTAAANHVMLRTDGGPNVTAMNEFALDLAGEWLDRIAADTSKRPLAEKVVANKPPTAVDACWIGGQRIEGEARIGAANQCEATYPPHSLPDLRAGKPVGSLVAKCELEAINPSAYPGMTPAQLERLAAIFPEGVCDFSRPGVGEQPFAGGWQEFGPERRAKPRKRRLGLSGPRTVRAGSKVKLAAKLRPCPRVSWQRVALERKRRGGWRPLAAGVAEGRRCKARFAVRVDRPTVLRVRSKAISGFRGTKSKRLRVGVR